MMDSDNEADDFYSTITAHRGDAQFEYESVDDTTGDFAEQTAQQIGKKSSVKPSKNPTHDTKYWGKKVSRVKLGKEVNEFALANHSNDFSDIDSEGIPEEEDSMKIDEDEIDESDDEQNWVSDYDDDGCQPTKKRKVDELADQSDLSEDEVETPAKEQSVSLFLEQKVAENKLGPSSSSSENEKGLAVRKQVELWEKILQIRILIQKALHAANELPLTVCSHSTENSEDSDSGSSSDKNDLKDQLDALLQSLIEMCHISMKGLPFGEELSSAKITPGKYEKDLNEIGATLVSEGTNLMQLWSEKIQLSSGRFSDKSSSFSGKSNGIPQQIETILADRSRLLKRTRTKRVQYVMASTQEHQNKPEEEFYDEYDFYQTLVKDLINSKSSGPNGFLEGDYPDKSDGFKLKNVKSITTQLVRKNKTIVYDIHAKLVGFMAPDNFATDWKNEAIDSLTLSIFDD